MKERFKKIRSEYTGDLKKACNHCTVWDDLCAAISQEPLIKLLQWYSRGFPKVRVLILSEVLAQFDINKGLRQGGTWFPTGDSGKPVSLLQSFQNGPAATFLIRWSVC